MWRMSTKKYKIYIYIYTSTDPISSKQTLQQLIYSHQPLRKKTKTNSNESQNARLFTPFHQRVLW